MNTFKVWNWSEFKERMTGFWPIGENLPLDILSGENFQNKTRSSFVSGRNAFFSSLEFSQPLVWKRLMDFPNVEVVQNKKYPTLVDVVAISGDHFIFFEPFSQVEDKEYWDQIFLYMPDFIICYYTNFNGMRGSRRMPGAPRNLPANDRKWQRVADYAKEESINKKDLKLLRERFVDLEKLFIFIRTDWQDLIFLDFNTKSKKIYVIPQNDFTAYFELDNASEIIDKLCAHVISGAAEPFYLKNFY